MSTQVLLDLPEEAYQRATQLAQLTSRTVTDVLADVLDLALPTLEVSSSESSMEEMNDEEILALTQLQMSTGEDAELSLLLDKQQADLLTEAERMQLARLLQLYQRGLLRKALALAEAVRRGIHPPLDS